MTIDEFVRDIAPKMRKGWVAMEENGIWNWFNNEPTAFKDEWKKEFKEKKGID